MFNHISKTNKTRKWNFPNFGFCLIVHFILNNSVMSLFTHFYSVQSPSNHLIHFNPVAQFL